MKRAFEFIKKNIRFILGVFLIFFGLLGLVLPIMPGWILIFIGLEFIGIRLVFVERAKEYAKSKIKKKKKEDE